jgi:phosphate transport system substrate-binding protein
MRVQRPSATRASLVALAAVLLCPLPSAGCHGGAGLARRIDRSAAIRVAGSDTMVNLLQAWAEHYGVLRPGVSVQVAGGGSGAGIAGLIDGTLDIAAASRELQAAERQRSKARHGVEPVEQAVARDALAVYVHRDNPLDAISLATLADVYGERAAASRWSHLGVRPAGCRSDEIIRVGRQSNSGTFAYFRQVVLGRTREYELGSIDQSGSKDVVALIARTPCAIGYSGIAFATAGVKPLGIVSGAGPPVRPSADSVLDGTYPIARPLYLYTATAPSGPAAAFVAWVLAPAGQRIVRDLGLVPIAPPGPSGAGGRP